MVDDWKTWGFRQRVVSHLENLICQTPTQNQRNAQDLELKMFQRASKKEEYLQLIANIAKHMQPSPATQTSSSIQLEDAAYAEKVRQLSKYVAPLRRMIQRIGKGNAKIAKQMKQLHDLLQNLERSRIPMDMLLKCERILEKLKIHHDALVPRNMENNNPHRAEVLTHHPVPGSQIVGPGQMTGPGGLVVTGPNTTTIMAGQQSKMQGAPRLGQPMPANIPNQATDMANWPTNNRQQLTEMQMSGVNKKQPVITVKQIVSQTGEISKIQMSIGSQCGGTAQIGQVSGQTVGIVGRGAGTVQPRVPSPGFPQQGTPTSASRALPLSASTSEPLPAFVSPSTSSNMVHSPAAGSNSGGMGQGANHIGAPSPSGMINNPEQSRQSSPATQTLSSSQGEDAAYAEQVHQLGKYITPLRHMIQRAGNKDAEKSEILKQILDILQNLQRRRMPMDTLLKCEMVLQKLGIQCAPEVEAPLPPNMETYTACFQEGIATVLLSFIRRFRSQLYNYYTQAFEMG